MASYNLDIPSLPATTADLTGLTEREVFLIWRALEALSTTSPDLVAEYAEQMQGLTALLDNVYWAM